MRYIICGCSVDDEVHGQRPKLLLLKVGVVFDLISSNTYFASLPHPSQVTLLPLLPGQTHVPLVQPAFAVVEASGGERRRNSFSFANPTKFIKLTMPLDFAGGSLVP